MITIILLVLALVFTILHARNDPRFPLWYAVLLIIIALLLPPVLAELR